MGFSKQNDDDIMADINITPLVDIMLVLLIIFMLVSTVVDMNAIRVDLPKAATGAALETRTASVMITREGTFYLDGERIQGSGELMSRLEILKKTHADLQVIIGADKRTYHEDVVRVIDLVRGLGIARFAIQVDAVGSAG